MLQNLTIKNYRGISTAELTGLRPFSVISGANNAGKTTVLEAMALFTQHTVPGSHDGDIFQAVFGHRRVRNLRASLRFNPDANGSFSDGQSTVEIGRPPNSPYTNAIYGNQGQFEINDNYEPSVFGRTRKVCFVAAPPTSEENAMEATWSFAFRNGFSREVLAAAVGIDSSIKSLQIVYDGRNNPTLYAESTSGDALKAWPVSAGGSGFKRLLLLVAQVAGSRGLICLDDPDAFLHPKMFTQLATFLWGLVDSGAQVVVSTHSVELIDAFARDINGPPKSDQFGVFGFVRSPTGTLNCDLRLHGATAQLSRRRDDIRRLLGLET